MSLGHGTLRVVSEILDLLRRVPPDKVRQDLQRVRREQARLAAEQELLERVLALHEQQEGAQGSPDGSVQFGAGGRRARILEILARDPDRQWSPAEIISALKEEGPAGSEANIRVLLRRMVDRGQLEHPAFGAYKLPATQTDAQGAVDDEGADQE